MKLFTWLSPPPLKVITLLLLGSTIWSQNGCKPIDSDVVPPTTRQPQSGAREGEDLNANVRDETPTILGQQMPNPYTVPNMKQAYRNLGRSNWNSITTTHNYVRFRPASVDQLRTLEEDLDMELSDTPLDYMVAQEGDYYQDPAVPDEQITYQYAVVRVGAPFPSNIPYDFLAAIHLPDDIALETEAERLVGLNSDGELGGGPTCPTCNGSATQSDEIDCGPDSHWDPQVHACVLNPSCPYGQHFDANSNTCIDNCPPGYQWDGSDCIPSVPSVPPGRITLTDTRLGVQGVRKVRLVARRWFKIDRIYTNNDGYFHFSTRFKNKVKLFVKFKNDDAIVREIRTLRFWKMFFPVKQHIGTFSGPSLNDTNHGFARAATVDARGTRFWVAATAHNNVQEYKDLIAGQGTAAPPTSLKIQISDLGNAGGGAAPLFRVRTAEGLVEAFIRTFALSTGGPAAITAATVTAVTEILKRQVDIMYSYKVDNVEGLTSDGITEVMYHELSHAATYTQAGSDWYSAFVNAEINEIIATVNNSDFSPYGAGNNMNSPIIAVGEGWASHYGHVLADMKYGANTGCQNEQPGGAFPCPNGTIHPHIDVLELFDPQLPTDNFRWIPIGVFLDLNDNNVPLETRPVDDQVSGYTNQQMFSAIESDVRFVQAYRDRLLAKYGSGQATQVTNLFVDYGYN